MRNTSMLRTLAVAGAVLVGMAAGAPAFAKPVAPQAAKPTGHCVVAMSKVAEAKTTCFGTFAEATSFATHGRVTGAQVSQLGTAEFAEAVGQSNRKAVDSITPQAIVLSWEYEGNPRPGAWTLTFTGDFNCSVSFADVDYQWILDPIYWDQISSFASPSYVCYVNHYFLQNFTSQNTGYYVCTPGAFCFIPLMQPGNINGDNNTRALRWT